MYLLKKLLKIPCYKFIGRGGMLYFNGTQEFFIGTENYIKNKSSRDGYGVTIFAKNTRLKKIPNNLSDIGKNRIAIEVKNLLAKNKIIATVE